MRNHLTNSQPCMLISLWFLVFIKQHSTLFINSLPVIKLVYKWWYHHLCRLCLKLTSFYCYLVIENRAFVISILLKMKDWAEQTIPGGLCLEHSTPPGKNSIAFNKMASYRVYFLFYQKIFFLNLKYHLFSQKINLKTKRKAKDALLF